MFNHKWNTRFFNLAEHVASWSKDPSTKVGAIIANGKFLVSIGYNGLPSGIKDSEERLLDRDTKLKLTIHAEENAILSAKRDLTGYQIYTWPLAPCAKCASKIIQSGIKHVFIPTVSPDSPELESQSRWREETDLATSILLEANVWVHRLYGKINDE